MNDYEIRLLLEGMCQTYSSYELSKCHEIIRHLLGSFQLTKREAKIVLCGAYEIKRVRERTGLTLHSTNFHIH